MKWIGYTSLADITSVTAGTGLSGGGRAGDVTLDVDASIPEITTLAGLTSFGSTGATTSILAGDLTMYNPVNDGDPTFSIGSSASERLMIFVNYASGGTQTFQEVFLRTFTDSAVADYGGFVFSVDETNILRIRDAGIYLETGKGISIAGTDILTDSSGTATLSNIDVLDATTIATIEAAVETNIDTLSNTLGITIDTDRDSDAGTAGAENSTALHVDFDRAVPESGTYAHNDRGIDLDVNSRSLGTSSLYGMDIDVIGHTGGTSTAYGIDLNVSGADTNIGMQVLCEGEQLRLSHNEADYATFTVADTGDLTIETVGDGTRDSDLILDADGEIKLEASGDIKLDTTTGFCRFTSTATSAAGTGPKLNLISNDGAALEDDHMLGRIAFAAAEDSSGTLKSGAKIEAYADAAWSASENGTRLEFYTMDGNASQELSLTLDSDLLATFAGAVTVTGALTGTLATASQPNITTVGTIGTGAWQGTAIASAYLDADTAHLSGSQTFTGTKTLNSFKGTGSTTVTNILDEDAMGSDSATALATQQSIKAYADTKVSSDTTRQLTHHMIKDDIGTGVIYISLGEIDAESGTKSNKNLPLLAPVAGKLLKVFLRTGEDMSGSGHDTNLTWRLLTRTTSVTTDGNSAVIGTQTGAGPTASSMVTYDFTSSLDSGTNVIAAGDKVQLSVQSDAASEDMLFFITCLWEWDLS